VCSKREIKAQKYFLQKKFRVNIRGGPGMIFLGSGWVTASFFGLVVGA
jgi:hypothetical protein